MQIRFAAVTLLFLFAGLFALTLTNTAYAATTLPTKMNFQGRITNPSGNILVNGTYNMKFRIWSAASGGTQQWSEDRLISAGQGVSVTNGQFSVQLGSVTSLPASVFSSNSLYFEVELPTPASATTASPVWTEGAMTPRNQLATSAYAYNSETLDGLDSDAFAKLGSANLFTAANSIDVSSSSAFQVKNGSTNLFNVSTTTSQITIGTSDTTGALLVLDVKTDTGDPAGTNGAMYYNANANKFRCYQAGAWTDCVSTGGGGSGALQDAYNASTSPALITTTSGTKTFAIQAGSGFDATALFKIADSAAVSLFSVDTSNKRVYIGNPTADSIGAILVLDTKNTSGDPTGVDGAMYYNSQLASFRCYEAGAWKNCASGPIDIRSFVDTTVDAAVDANTTSYWDLAAENNNATPNLSLSNASGSIFGIVSMETTSTGSQDSEISARIVRGVGSVPTCTGTSVGGNLGTFSSNTGGSMTSSVTFLDVPGSTQPVYYIVCSDAATVGTTANITRIRVTLQEVNNSN